MSEFLIGFWAQEDTLGMCHPSSYTQNLACRLVPLRFNKYTMSELTKESPQSLELYQSQCKQKLKTKAHTEI